MIKKNVLRRAMIGFGGGVGLALQIALTNVNSLKCLIFSDTTFINNEKSTGTKYKWSPFELQSPDKTFND